MPVTAAGTWTKCTDLHRVTSPDEHSASNRLRSAHGVSSRVVLDYPVFGNIGNIFPQNYPQIVRFAGVPRGRHRVLPRLVVRERYFREGKCREENHGTSPWDGGPDAIGDTRQQYLPAVQCTFACTRLVGTCQRASRTTRLVVRCVRLCIRDDGRLSVREVKSWAFPRHG